MLKGLGIPDPFFMPKLFYMFDKNSKKMQKESTKRIANSYVKKKRGVDVSDSHAYGENIKIDTML